MNRIPVFYSDAQVHDAGSFSKSPLKPGLLVRKIALDPCFEVIDPVVSITAEELYLVHDDHHVDAVLSAEIEDGFGNRSLKSIDAIKHTVGNLVQSARFAVSSNPIVWSLTSGFHHAGHNFCGGYCTFDALTLAAEELHRARNLKTLIIDEDAHYGNGCVNIIAMRGMEDYCRYHQSSHTHGDPGAEGATGRYGRELNKLLDEFKPDLILYQAGADNWVGDPLGGSLTMQQLYLRDLITFQAASDRDIPVVVNLAGGYADHYDDTLTIHMNTGEAMKEVFLGQAGNPIYPISAVVLENM